MRLRHVTKNQDSSPEIMISLARVSLGNMRVLRSGKKIGEAWLMPDKVDTELHETRRVTESHNRNPP